MAFVRKGKDSDVYIAATAAGGYANCIGCLFTKKDGNDKEYYTNYFKLDNIQQVVFHLGQHLVAGHKVPKNAFRIAFENMFPGEKK